MNEPLANGDAKTRSGPADAADRTKSLVAAIRQHWRVVLVCVIVAPVVAVGLSLLQTKQYTSVASLLFRDPGLDQKLFGATYTPPATDPDRRAATNLKLAELDVVFDEAARRLRQPSARVRDAVTVSASGQSDVVEVRATTNDPADSAAYANAVAGALVDIRQQADRSSVQDAQQLVDRQLRAADSGQGDESTAKVLRQRAEQLSVLAALQTGGVSIVQPAETADDPSAPRPRRNGVAGLLVGLVAGIGLALLLSRMDRRVRTPADLEGIFGRPVVGEVPESRALAADAFGARLPAMDHEAFRMLRANLIYFNVDEPIRSILVMSSGPGEGKSTVSWRLAAAAADAGDRVLLIEADLRRPTMARRRAELVGRPGLSDVLTGRTTRAEAVTTVALGPDEGARTMDVLPAGATPPNPADLLESHRMQALIAAAQEDYDFVVIDTPPVLVVSDVVPLVGRVSGVITVSRIDHTTKTDAVHLAEQLQLLRAPVLGVVANGLAGAGDRRYGYGYYAAAGTPAEPS